MLINAVSTLEIEIAECNVSAVKYCVENYISRFEKMPGCLAYGLTNSALRPNFWLLSGYWESKEAMRTHFAASELNAMIWMIGRRALGVRFSSYFPQTGGEG
ncbi:antibiotic biosynthesis monooxygenase [Pseudomonas beijingensis]|uniref:Antibiotic biosynthesis monooxygenase n=1 Tax=Pseudomonas beijingensis TaxID=2954101 RepID=A0ABY9F6W5_9PSED|nr:antibiotic biosynthesis monooxygenase [Pseudomonas sp. FP2034]WLG98849.1 antibiotic biosynthesis monooxygenase [Pseudomonas sp. FP2034]